MSTNLIGQGITLVCLLTFVAAVLWWTHALNRRRLLRLADLLDEHSGEVTGFRILRLEGHYQGRPVSFRIRMASVDGLLAVSRSLERA